MTTPSRRHEILKQRTRKRKITGLRRRFKNAGTEVERGQILDKLARLSPTMTLEQFTREKQASS